MKRRKKVCDPRWSESKTQADADDFLSRHKTQAALLITLHDTVAAEKNPGEEGALTKTIPIFIICMTLECMQYSFARMPKRIGNNFLFAFEVSGVDITKEFFCLNH